MNSQESKNSHFPISEEELLTEFKDYRLIIEGCVPGTVKLNLLYAKRFIDLLGVTKIQDFFNNLTFKRVLDCVLAYAKSHTPGSCTGFQTHTRTFLRYCWLKGYVKSDFTPVVPPIRKRKLSTIPRGIPPECIHRLYRIIDDSVMPGIRDVAIIRILATYGVRGIHIRNLKLEDINWEEDIITFPATKRGKPIRQHLTVEVGNSLLNYLKNGRPAVNFPELFLNSTSPFRPILEASTLNRIVSRYLKRKEVKLPVGVSTGTHGFRHAFGARMVGKVPIKNIADMLGHRSLSSAFIYSKVNIEALRSTTQTWAEVEDE